MIIIAPLDANTLAKLASGLCDNLLVSVSLLSIILKKKTQFLSTSFLSLSLSHIPPKDMHPARLGF